MQDNEGNGPWVDQKSTAEKQWDTEDINAINFFQGWSR